MEGGDLLGAYERACELAEMNARLAGIENPISAHATRERINGRAKRYHAAKGFVQVSL